MKNRVYHFLFWLIYLSYTTFTVYLIGRSSFIFPTTIFDILISNVITSILPFYAFYYVIFFFVQRKVYLKSALLFIFIVTPKLFIEYYGYQAFQNMLYGRHENYPFLYVSGMSLSSDIRVLIFSIAYFYLTRTKTAQQELLIVQKEKLEIEQKKLQADMAYLKAQINPHFLQNVLNFFYAQALPHSDKLAEGILSLSEIMRYAMDKNVDEKGLVWISNEIRFVKKFIKINDLRFQGNIFINFSITGDDLSALKIIPMVLITLVENAFKHGELHTSQWPVQIEAHYNEVNRIFLFSVANRKKRGPKELSHGIGLENIEARLRMEYGDNSAMTMEDDIDSYKATVTIKY